MSTATAFDANAQTRSTPVPAHTVASLMSNTKPQTDIGNATVNRAAPARSGDKSCPIDKDRFLAKAGSLLVTVGTTVPGAQVVVAMGREFSTGGYGYYASGKTQQLVDGVPVDVQVGISVSVVGGKPDASPSAASQCAITKEEFLAYVKANPTIPISLGGTSAQVGAKWAGAKVFNKGSYGWYAQDKVTLMLGDKPVLFQVSANLTLVHSGK